MKNVVWQTGHVKKEERNKLLGYNNKVIWFTGLSCSGKSTLARSLEKKLHEKNIISYVLDGDNIRHGLNKDLSFSPEDRNENIRRITEVSKILHDTGIFVIVAFISPYKQARNAAKDIIGEDFVEVFVDCPLEVCEKRDTKNLYKMAREGKIKDFTGIDSAYEAPENPHVTLKTDQWDVNTCIDMIIKELNLSK